MTNYLILVHRLDLIASGPTTSILGLYDFLFPKGKTTLLTLYGKSSFRENQINLETKSLLSRKGLSTKLIKVVWRLLSGTNHNVVILNGAWALYNYVVVFICILRDSDVIWFPRGCLMPLAIKRGRYRLSTLLKQCALLTFERFVMMHSSRIIVTSEMEKESIPAIYWDKVLIRSNPVKVNRCLLENSDSRMRENYILFLGRIHPIKRIDKLILSAIANDFKLIIAGPDFNNYWAKLNESFEVELRENITYVGPVFGEEKFDLIEGARYLALVSDSENFGNVVLEALGHGTPVIVSEGVPWTPNGSTIYNWESFCFNEGLDSHKTSDIIKDCHQQYLDMSFELW